MKDELATEKLTWEVRTLKLGLATAVATTLLAIVALGFQCSQQAADVKVREAKKIQLENAIEKLAEQREAARTEYSQLRGQLSAAKEVIAEAARIQHEREAPLRRLKRALAEARESLSAAQSEKKQLDSLLATPEYQRASAHKSLVERVARLGKRVAHLEGILGKLWAKEIKVESIGVEREREEPRRMPGVDTATDELVRRIPAGRDRLLVPRVERGYIIVDGERLYLGDRVKGAQIVSIDPPLRVDFEREGVTFSKIMLLSDLLKGVPELPRR